MTPNNPPYVTTVKTPSTFAAEHVYNDRGIEIVYIYAVPTRTRVRPNPDPEKRPKRSVDLSYLYRNPMKLKVFGSVDKRQHRPRLYRHRR